METVTKILSVAVGGAFGSVARYLISISPLQNLFGAFPFPTFLINIIGSFLIGFFFVLLSGKFAVSDNLKLAVTVGFLGAFTTFSTFELELWNLFEESRYLIGFLYLFLSVAVGFVGVVAGITLAKNF